MSFSIIIPAQETNRYHKKGDLAPFGDTTLLQWKIAQCKEIAKPSQIYISSENQTIKEIAEEEEVNFIKREENLSYSDVIHSAVSKIKSEVIIWANCTSPFIDSKTFIQMYEKFIKEDLESLITVEKKKEYVFFQNQKLNFDETLISRKDIEPIYIMTNSCYIIKKDIVEKTKKLLTQNPSFFEIDSFSSIEINNRNDYSLAKELINLYFKKDLDV